MTSTSPSGLPCHRETVEVGRQLGPSPGFGLVPRYARLSAAWRDKLKAAGDANDEYFVGRLTKNWAGFNTGKPATDWLKSPARRW